MAPSPARPEQVGRCGLRFQASLGKAGRELRTLLVEIELGSSPAEGGKLKCSHTGGDVWSLVPGGGPGAISACTRSGPRVQKCNAWDAKGRNPAMNVWVRLAPCCGSSSGDDEAEQEDTPLCKLGLLVQWCLPQLAQRVGWHALELDWVSWAAESDSGVPVAGSVVDAFGSQDQKQWSLLQQLAKEREAGAGIHTSRPLASDPTEELALRRAKSSLVEAARFFGPATVTKVSSLTVRKLYQREYHFFDASGQDVADSRRHALEWAVGPQVVARVLAQNKAARAKLSERLTGPALTTSPSGGRGGSPRKRSRTAGAGTAIGSDDDSSHKRQVLQAALEGSCQVIPADEDAALVAGSVAADSGAHGARCSEVVVEDAPEPWRLIAAGSAAVQHTEAATPSPRTSETSTLLLGTTAQLPQPGQLAAPWAAPQGMPQAGAAEVQLSADLLDFTDWLAAGEQPAPSSTEATPRLSSATAPNSLPLSAELYSGSNSRTPARQLQQHLWCSSGQQLEVQQLPPVVQLPTADLEPSCSEVVLHGPSARHLLACTPGQQQVQPVAGPMPGLSPLSAAQPEAWSMHAQASRQLAEVQRQLELQGRQLAVLEQQRVGLQQKLVQTQQHARALHTQAQAQAAGLKVHSSPCTPHATATAAAQAAAAQLASWLPEALRYQLSLMLEERPELQPWAGTICELGGRAAEEALVVIAASMGAA